MKTRTLQRYTARNNKLSSLNGISDELVDSPEQEFNPAWLADLRVLTMTLPLSTSDYELLNRRLDNSERYADNGQTGAARFEVKHVVGSLKKMFGLKQLLKMWVDTVKN